MAVLREAWESLLILRRARSSSRWPLERQRAHQGARLAALVRHAEERVPLYRAFFAEAGLRADHVRSLEDLARLPVLSKERLRSAPREERIARGSDPRTLSEVRTSGSTGAPLGIWLGPFERAWQRAVAWRVLFEHGFRWTDRTLEIRRTAGPSSRLQALGVAPKDWASILDPPQRWARLLAERRHPVVVAGAGTLRALAEAWRELGHGPPHPRIVVSDSETLDPRARAEIAGALGTAPVDVYGLVELSNFAWECEARRGFHVSADSHLVEVDAAP
ncbi:MAG TPA: hypothetical protein VMK65_03075, partial [Longimicrobiales bacterium]|nr:hypothetical protein [Longimicrobiales bacterium]